MSRKGKEVVDSSEDSRSESTAALNRGGGNVASSSSTGRGNIASSSTGGGAVARSSKTAEEGSHFWSTDLHDYCFGKVSTAVMQANLNLEDLSQVEVGRTAIFVGVYDGQGSDEASFYVSRNLTRNLMDRIRSTLTMSEDHLRQAFLRTEASWLEKVGARFETDPYIAGYGTCCLAGVIWRKILYLANAGDSRAVIAREEEGSEKFVAHQLTRDDNVREAEVRAEVEALHPNEPDIIVKDAQGVYRIKGRVQVSRSIGYAYLKKARYTLNQVDKRFELNSPVLDRRPALTADPNTCTVPIQPHDRFVIFASDGLWDIMTNQEAVDIVQKHPREGIAAKLITEGLTKEAVRLDGLSYEDILLYRRGTGERRRIHDDISVVVIFFDHTLQAAAEINEEFKKNSIRQGSVSTSESNFIGLDQLDVFYNEAHILSRLVFLNNLPYGSNFFTLYPLLPGPTIEFGRHGFTCRILFYEVVQAIRFVTLHRNSLILFGKLCCVSYIWEEQYRSTFNDVDLYCTRAEVPFTIHVSNLSQEITAGAIAIFFLGHGLSLRNFPIMHIAYNGELYAFASFRTVAEHDASFGLDGLELLGRRIRITLSRYPPRFQRRFDLLG